jgi:hypothetical protein
MRGAFQELQLAIRLVFIAVVGIVGIPFVVSSPGKTAFWITLGAVAAVMLPGLCVSTYFLTDLRRIRRNREN